MITRVFFSQRRKMLKSSLKEINGEREVADKFNINLNLRPQNLEPEMYFKLVKEYERLRR